MSPRLPAAAPVATPDPPVVPAPPAASAVPAEYLSLYAYLERRYASMVVLTFEQIESLLGRALPELARTRTDWWSDVITGTDRHCATWTTARRTAIANLQARTVAFERLP
jgi:hypothetical protein